VPPDINCDSPRYSASGLLQLRHRRAPLAVIGD
jgi:hypothetical protein